MSTELRNATDTVTQTRFSGGEERGACVQLTQARSNGSGYSYIQLTREEALAVAAELVLFATSKEVEKDENFRA